MVCTHVHTLWRPAVTLTCHSSASCMHQNCKHVPPHQACFLSGLGIELRSLLLLGKHDHQSHLPGAGEFVSKSTHAVVGRTFQVPVMDCS